MGTRTSVGTRVSISGWDYQVNDYSVSESSSPLSISDSSGGVGEFSFSFALPDPYSERVNPEDPILEYGPLWLVDQPMTLLDSRNGLTKGTVRDIAISEGDICTASGFTNLDTLNVYNINAQPFSGTLEELFEYYLSLVEITTDYRVDPSIASRPVTVPGWSGEMWYRLKQLVAAQDCEIALVSGIVLFRPVRTRVAERGKDISRDRQVSSGALAQAIEVYWYSTEEITDGLVYPPGGWDPQVEVLNVNAGETSEYQLDLSASVSSIQTPVMGTSVDEDYDASSVYTIVGDDGFPVPVDLWADNGGELRVSINPDTKSLTLTLVGASNIPVTTGGYSKAFSVALASDTSGNRYSTLRIVGTGVRYTRELRRFRTGVPASRTATEVGLTLDNPFITDKETLFRAGVRAAKAFSGNVPTVSGQVTAVNRRGDTGVADYPTYQEVQTDLGSSTYGEVKTFYLSDTTGTYAGVRNYWYSIVQSSFANQSFGNVAGARIWDERTKRWYRIRQGSVGEGAISFSGAEDDLLFSDLQGFHEDAGRTYGDVQTLKSGLTYLQERLSGMYA